MVVNVSSALKDTQEWIKCVREGEKKNHGWLLDF